MATFMFYMDGVIINHLSCYGSSAIQSNDENVVITNSVHRFNVDHGNQKIQTIRLIKLKDNSTKIPILIRSQTRLGAFRVYENEGYEDVIFFIGPRQNYIYLPVSEDIVSYVFLLRSLGSDYETTEWHLYDIKSDTLEFVENSTIKVPLISSLPKLAENKEIEQLYLRLIYSAEKKLDMIKK